MGRSTVDDKNDNLRERAHQLHDFISAYTGIDIHYIAEFPRPRRRSGWEEVSIPNDEKALKRTAFSEEAIDMNPCERV